MMEVVFLGTAGSFPTRDRNLVATLIICGNKRFLVDCSEGVQRQILRSGRGLRNLCRILITHAHLDHFLGLAGLIFTLDTANSVRMIEVFGNVEVQDAVSKLLDIFPRKSNLVIKQVTIDAGVVYEDEGLKCSTFECSHTVKCHGFVFEERGGRRFLKDKAREFGVPEGPLRRQLVEGKTVDLPNGSCVTPDMVLSAPEPGAKLVYVSDSTFSEILVENSRNADVLISEATFLDRDRSLAARFGHLTAKEAALLAKRANVGRLVINHISSRYREKDIVNEATSVFSNSGLANDFDLIRLTGRP